MALGCFKAISLLDSLSNLPARFVKTFLMPLVLTQSILHSLKEGEFWWDACTGSTEMFHQMLTWELCACALPLLV